MSFFSRLFGLGDDAPRRSSPDVVAGMGSSPVPDTDAQAIERYRYMLRTAPPETLEQAHAEAFGKLTAEQRQKVISQLSEGAPPGERAAIAATPAGDPQALARVATRAEVRSPGTLERTLGGAGAGMGMGTSLLASFAMGFAGSMIAQSFFSAMGGLGDGGEQAAADDAAHDDAEGNAGYEDDMGGDDFDV